MKRKIYCKYCKYFYSGESYTGLCKWETTHCRKKVDTYYEQIYKLTANYMYPDQNNKKNNCQHYKCKWYKFWIKDK